MAIAPTAGDLSSVLLGMRRADRYEHQKAHWQERTRAWRAQMQPILVGLRAQIARGLALADGPMTAAELATGIVRSGPIRDHTMAIRSQLRSFVQRLHRDEPRTVTAGRTVH